MIKDSQQLANVLKKMPKREHQQLMDIYSYYSRQFTQQAIGKPDDAIMPLSKANAMQELINDAIEGRNNE